MKTKYINLLSNESAKSQGWMFATIFLTCFCIYIGYLLKVTLDEMPVRLVPYDYSTSKGVVETTKNGQNNQEYIQLIARSDVDLFSEFRPENALTKTKLLLNRMSTDLYIAGKDKMLDQAKNNADEKITQTYRIDKIISRDGHEALIFGYLNRWEGTKNIAEGFVNYALTYVYKGGIPYIDDFQTFEKQSEIIKKLNKDQ